MKLLITLIKRLFKKPFIFGYCRYCNHPESTHSQFSYGNPYSSIHPFGWELSCSARGKKFFNKNENKCRCSHFEIFDNLSYLEQKVKEKENR